MADETTQSSDSGKSTAPDSAAIAGASEIIKRGRGRPKGSSGGTPENAGGKPAVSGAMAQQQAELQAQFDRLYDPLAWEGIVAAPANIAFAVTGNKVWDLPKDEVKTLAIHASVTARCFAVSDPKWLALTMLSISMLTIYGGRTLQYFAEKAESKRAAENVPLAK